MLAEAQGAYRTIKVQSQETGFGAEVAALDLSKPLDAATLAVDDHIAGGAFEPADRVADVQGELGAELAKVRRPPPLKRRSRPPSGR